MCIRDRSGIDLPWRAGKRFASGRGERLQHGHPPFAVRWKFFPGGTLEYRVFCWIFYLLIYHTRANVSSEAADGGRGSVQIDFFY